MGLRGAAVEDVGLAWCASVQTRPRLRSRPAGGGLAFLLRGSLTGCLGDRIRGHPRRLCVPTPRAGRRFPSSPGTPAEAQPGVVEPDHSESSIGKFLAGSARPAGPNSLGL